LNKSVVYIWEYRVAKYLFRLAHYKCQTINNRNLSILRLKANSPHWTGATLLQHGRHTYFIFMLPIVSPLTNEPEWERSQVCVCARQVIKITNNDDYENWLHVINSHFKLLCHYIMVYMPESPSGKVGQRGPKSMQRIQSRAKVRPLLKFSICVCQHVCCHISV